MKAPRLMPAFSALGVVAWLLALLVILAVAAALIGRYPIAPADVLAALARRLGGQPAQTQIDTVLFEIRLPRIAAAVLVGGALAAAGAAYQGLFRNPLVSPDILHDSGGSGPSAVVAIVLSLQVLGVKLPAFLSGLAAVCPGALL